MNDYGEEIIGNTPKIWVDKAGSQEGRRCGGVTLGGQGEGSRLGDKESHIGGPLWGNIGGTRGGNAGG